MDDGAPPPEEDFSLVPIAERLAHKNWKARVHGYEALIKAFAATGSETDPAFRPYLQNPDTLKKMVTDSNVVAQEKGVDAVFSFVKFAGENAAKTRETVVPALVDKCFGSTRQGTKQKAWAVVLEYVEVENSGEGVTKDIILGLSAKQPKAVAGTVIALNEIFRVFGTKVTPPGPVLKTFSKIFGHADKTVRAEGTVLAQTLYTWLGPAIQPALAELKPMQIKELSDSFEALDKDGKGQGTGRQERYTKAQVREREAAEMSGVDEAGPEEPEPIDPRTFADEVDIIPKIPQEFHAQIASSKWKERKETLDAVYEVVKDVTRMKDSDGISELIKALAKRMTDANVMCVMVAANIIGFIAKGLGQPFAKYKPIVVPPMLERFKERKQNVVDAIGAGLDDVFTTTTFPDITEDLLNSLKSKNPQVKEGTLKFFNRCLSSTKIPPEKTDTKPIAELLVTLLADSSELIRVSAQEGLGILMKIIGERALNPFLEPVDDIKKAKVKEAFEKATVKCKVGGAPASSKPPPPASAPPKKPPPKVLTEIPLNEDEPPSKPLAKPPARLLGRKAAAPPSETAESGPPPPPLAKPALAPKKVAPAAAAAAAASVKTAKTPAGAGAASPSDSFKYKFTPEDAEALATDLIPSQLATDLGDSAWKVRLAALEDAFPSWLDSVIDSAEAEIIFRFLGKKPGWNEKNFQVSAKVFAVLTTLAERSPTFGKACVALATPHLTDKLGDIKLKKPAGDALLIFAEKTSLSFVLGLAYDPISKQKAPKMLADSVAWMNTALTDFGISGLTLRPLVEFLKQALKNSNAAVRSSATSTLVTLRLFAGSGIKDLLEDVNPQLLMTIQSEFDKVDGQPAPVPTRISADVANAPVPKSGGKEKAAGGDPLDELFPRIDLEKLVGATNILTEAKNDAWKSRKEALEMLQAMLDVGANKRLKPNLGDTVPMLKARLADTNKAVQSLALDIVSRIALGVNKPFEKYCRILVPSVAQVMADQKNNIRAAGAATLTAIATACESIDPLAHSLGTALESPNPLLRSTLLGWISSWLKENPPGPSTDLSSWTAPLVTCLEDRSADVRKGAQAVLPTVMAHVGFDSFMDKTNALKPASRSAVVPLLQAAKQNLPSSTPSSSVPNSTSASTIKGTLPGSSSEPTVAAQGTSAPQRKGLLARKFGPPTDQENRPASPVAHPSAVKAKGFGLKRPTSVIAKPPTPAPIASSAAPFVGVNIDVKRARLAKDAGRWIIESGPARKDLAEVLQHQMELHASRELVALLFSHDHNAINDHIAGLGIIHECYSSTLAGEESFGMSLDDMKATLIANADLPLKYVSTKVHEPQPNLISKCLDLVDSVLALLGSSSYVLSDAEAACFVPTFIHKLGDARELVRQRVQAMMQTLPKVYSSSRLFALLMEHGLRSKVAKTRQGALDEMSNIIRKKGIAVCDPPRAFPVIASMVGDKDATVRKSALSVIGEGYILEGDKVWTYLGRLDSKVQTQVEEKLKRLSGPVKGSAVIESPLPASVSRIASSLPRPGSPSGITRRGTIPRPASPAGVSRLARPISPSSSPLARSSSPPYQGSPSSPTRTQTSGAGPSSPSRPRTIPSSRLAAPRTRPVTLTSTMLQAEAPVMPRRSSSPDLPSSSHPSETLMGETLLDRDSFDEQQGTDEISITISSILSGDPNRSVDALKKIQKILDIPPVSSPASLEFQGLANHTDGLIETITLQMAHVFERPGGVADPQYYRLAKHLIQTLNAFCDHAILAETLPVDILTSLLEELTTRLLQTDESTEIKVKDLSRFINMIILRLFSTGRRIHVFRALFNLLLQITKPFTAKGTSSQSREAKLAELVLKCMWKLARGIPADLEKGVLDPVEIFPALESFLQTIPPNEWRARATSKVPCGDMPLRTIKVVIQHVVGAFGDEVYDQLSASFDDPSATIVYPYVYRILNSANAAAAAARPPSAAGSLAPSIVPSMSAQSSTGMLTRPASPESSPTPPRRPTSSHTSISTIHTNRQRSDSNSITSGPDSSPSTPLATEPDPDAQLIEIIGHISSETTGALHKEGITELYQFLKAYPQKKPKVDKMLDATGPQFRKYLARALASRAAEDEDRKVGGVADALSKLEASHPSSQPSSPRSPTMSPSPRRTSGPISLDATEDRALSRLHDIFHYQRSSVALDSRRGSVASSNGHGSPLADSLTANGEAKHNVV